MVTGPDVDVKDSGDCENVVGIVVVCSVVSFDEDNGITDDKDVLRCGLTEKADVVELSVDRFLGIVDSGTFVDNILVNDTVVD